jgi:hypothetical protein
MSDACRDGDRDDNCSDSQQSTVSLMCRCSSGGLLLHPSCKGAPRFGVCPIVEQ